METLIQQTLTDLEAREGIRILLAVESGSRAWGFASPDSDYDVRFLYVRPAAFYLRLEGHRDVLELPISGLLDVNGWDLDKTLRLLHAANPTLFEWFSSPIVYRTSPFAERFLPVLHSCYSSRKGLWHYLSMARGHCREFLQGDVVKLKKYFYALRPVLACRWILDQRTPPPMSFADLAAAELPPDLRPIVDRLLDQKRNAPEVACIPRQDPLNAWLESEMTRIQSRINTLPQEAPLRWDVLDRLFLSELGLSSADCA